MKSVASLIALRYSMARKHNSFVAFINFFSVSGIALGLAALVIVISVMNGFELQLKQRVLGIAPHIVVKGEHADVDTLAHVNATTPYLSAEAIVQSRDGLRGVLVNGIQPSDMQQHSVLAQNMVQGYIETLREGEFNVIIGQALANQLQLRVGDQTRVMVAGASIYTPLGRVPSQRLVTVAAIFNLGSQLDDKVVYMHINDARKLLRYRKDTPNDTRLFLDDAFNQAEVAAALSARELTFTTWRAQQGPLFDAVKLEKNMMFLMLVLIIAVAAFNIVAALVMVVSEKKSDIAILQTQGMPPWNIMQIFMFNGLFNGLKGTFIGLALGVTVTLSLNRMLELAGVELYLSADGVGVPIDMQWMQIVSVTLLSIGLCVLASLYPAFRAMRVKPAQALQYE